MKIVIQSEDFSLQDEVDRLRANTAEVGAIATFTGLVRDYHDKDEVRSLVLEHYPGMTEKSLQTIAGEAKQRWPVLDLTIIHRVGELLPADQIVMVAVSSSHRKAAFAACEFIMDYLKTRAPFWKKSRGAEGDEWVDCRESDEDAANRWGATVNTTSNSD
jgi:molybdopterin synthase catalytic subunit